MERAGLCTWLGRWELGMFVLDLGGVYSRICFLQALESTGKDFPQSGH